MLTLANIKLLLYLFKTKNQGYVIFLSINTITCGKKIATQFNQLFLCKLTFFLRIKPYYNYRITTNNINVYEYSERGHEASAFAMTGRWRRVTGNGQVAVIIINMKCDSTAELQRHSCILSWQPCRTRIPYFNLSNKWNHGVFDKGTNGPGIPKKRTKKWKMFWSCEKKKMLL